MNLMIHSWLVSFVGYFFGEPITSWSFSRGHNLQLTESSHIITTINDSREGYPPALQSWPCGLGLLMTFISEPHKSCEVAKDFTFWVMFHYGRTTVVGGYKKISRLVGWLILGRKPWASKEFPFSGHDISYSTPLHWWFKKKCYQFNDMTIACKQTRWFHIHLKSLCDSRFFRSGHDPNVAKHRHDKGCWGLTLQDAPHGRISLPKYCVYKYIYIYILY